MTIITCPNCQAQLAPGATSCWACKHPVAAIAASVGASPPASRSMAATAAAPARTVVSAPSSPPRLAVQPALTPASPVLVEAEPVLERSVHGIFSKAEGVRDSMRTALERALAAHGTKGLVLKSTDFEHPCWVSVTCWIPVGGRAITERGSAFIRIVAKPYYRFDLEYEVTLTSGTEQWTASHLQQISDEHLRQIADFVMARGARPDFKDARLREHPWQILRPANAVQAVRTDWLAKLPGMLYLAGMVTLAIGIGVLLLIAGGILHWRLNKRRLLVRSSGKPTFEPRNLLRVDSWQAVINDAGPDAAGLRQELLATIGQPPSPGFRVRTERIWYWGLDTKEEREQIVLSFNRGIVFCQIHPYGRDLYVAWDAHLNRGTWVEQPVAKGVDRSSGRLIEVRAVTGGVQNVTEYDVSDVSCLLEWAHLQLVRIVKDYLARRQIDQEIDFKILRGNRQELTAPASGAQATGGFVRRMRAAVAPGN